MVEPTNKLTNIIVFVNIQTGSLENNIGDSLPFASAGVLAKSKFLFGIGDF
jgi:hypothetical protein